MYMQVIVDSGVVSTGRVLGNSTLMNVFSGGKAVSTTISSGGSMEVDGSAVSTTISKGGEMEVDRGRADRIKVLAGGTLVINRAATVTNVSWTPGVGTIEFDENVKIYDVFTSSYSGVYYASGGKLLSNTKTMSGKTLGENVSAVVMSGGKASSFSISQCGYLDVWSGGSVNSVKITGDGELIMRSGCTATNVAWTPTVGCIHIENGAKVTFTSSYSGIYLGTGEKLKSHVTSISGETVQGDAHIFKGGTAKKTKLTNDGWMVVWSGGVAQSTVIDNYAKLEVYSGGTATSSVLKYRGRMNVSGGVVNDTAVETTKLNIYGGTVNRTTFRSEGLLDVYGGVVNDTVADNTIISIYGGTVNRTSFSAGGMLNIYGGTVNSTKLQSWSYMILSGGMVNNTTVYDGSLIVSGGKATSTTVNYSYGSLEVSGGTVTSTTINMGSMFVRGGTATSTTVNNGGKMFALNGSAT